MSYLKVIVFISGIIFLCSGVNAQVTGVSGGLSFSSGIEYNTGNTGNPGLFVKTLLKLDKRLYIVPSVTIFKK